MDTQIVFLPAKAEDVPALLTAQIKAFEYDAVLHPGVEPGGPPGYDNPEYILRDIERYEYYKIVVDGQIVGGYGVVDEGDGHYYLDVLYVDPDFHSLGIGTNAMHFMESRHPDATRWTLQTPEYATRNQHFYEKLGYVKFGTEVEPGSNLRLIQYEKVIS